MCMSEIYASQKYMHVKNIGFFTRQTNLIGMYVAINRIILCSTLAHFLASALKILPKKNFLYFFLKRPGLKKFLIFSGNETFLYFGKGMLRTLAYLQPEAYSEYCQTSTMECFAKIAT